MEIVDSFLEKSKHKFLNNLVKIPKQFDWYLGLVIEVDNSTILNNSFEEKCNIIYEKSEKHLQLLNILLIDNYTLLLFGLDPTPFNNNIHNILISICKYLGCEYYRPTYMKCFEDMVFNAWGEQQYKHLIVNDKSYNLKEIKGI